MTGPAPAPRSRFEQETAVSPSAGGYDGFLTPDWNIGENPNGGYAMVPAVRAMALATERPDPLTVTAHFVRPAVGGAAAAIETSLVRAGRRTATVTGSLVQEERERLRLLGSFGDLGQLASPTGWDRVPPPVELPPVDECVPRQDLDQGVDLPILKNVDVRVDPRFERGLSDHAEITGWIRLADEGPVDVMTLVLFADAFPPSIFSLHGRIGWVPTLELTVHVRRRPVDGWIRARFRTDDLAGGLLVEDGELWDDSGALVARCRQIAVVTPA